jgi:DNA polymerase-3 subunit delta'
VADAAELATALPWLPPLPWQAATARELLARRASWPQALLLHGPRGIGKHALALDLALGLLCETPRADATACGECPSCRYAIAGQHPDLLRLELVEVDRESGELAVVDIINVDRVRELIEFAQLSSHRRGAKVAVIAPAERMNPAAANALLKTLEEPPAGTYILLVSDQPGRLPATIRSRCRQLPVAVPDAEAAQAWLVAQGVAEPAIVLAQAGGAPLAALAAAAADVRAERAFWLDALAAPRRMALLALAARVDAGGKEQRRARLAHAIDWLIAWTADLARVAAGAPAQRHPEHAAALAALAGAVAPVPLFRYHRSLLRQRALLVHPLQPRLVAEALLIDYRGLFG